MLDDTNLYLVRDHDKNYLPKKIHRANNLKNSRTFPGFFKIIKKSQDIPELSRTLLKFQVFPEPVGTQSGLLCWRRGRVPTMITV